MLLRTALLVATLVPSAALAADATSTSPGNVRFAKVANSAFDSYTRNPSQAQIDWMRAHYARLLTYTPYFDSRLSWFPDGWVYKDLYAIYVGTPLATQHPEWILRDANGNLLYIPYACSGGTCTQYAADPGNPAFRAYWIQQAGATLAAGYRGLFVDDVNLFLSRVGNGNGQPVVPVDPRTGAAMTEANWRRYMAEFTEQIRAAFPQKEIVHNAIWYVGVSDPYVQRELVAADVVCLERGINDSGIVHGGGTYGFDTMLGYIDWIHAHSRSVWFLAEAGTDQAREYGLAAYFLVSTGTDAIGNDPGGTPDDWWAGYDVSLGGAAGGRYTWNGLIRRDFDGGTVLLNEPGSPQVTVGLDAAYTDLAGNRRTTISLGAAQGAVLRSTGPSRPAPPRLLDVVPFQQ